MKEATRRDFLRTAAAAAAVGVLPGCRPTDLGPSREQLPAYEAGRPLPWRNWAANQGCRPQARVAPGGEEALLALLGRAEGPVRPVGAGHSFSALVPSDGTLVAADAMHGVHRVEAAAHRAEVWAGTRLHRLGPLLAEHGQAMPNLPDIDYQTLGGAIATATHGTGATFGALSAPIAGLTIATPRGQLIACDRDNHAEVFHAARCSLGALGVVTRVVLQNQAPVRLSEVSRVTDLDEVLEDVERHRDRHRHFEFFAFPHTRGAMTVATDPAEPGSEDAAAEDVGSVDLLRDVFRLAGALPLVGSRLYDWLVTTMASGEPVVRIGPSYRILTHPRITRFREMEYTVPAEAGPACLREVLATIRERRIPVVFPIEYRYTRADDVWLSMFHERDGCSISIHQYADLDHQPYFDAIEPVFWKYEGRPHWGKLHSLGASALRERYPRWRDFLAVREALDPHGRFLNPHLSALFGLEPTA